MSPTDGTIVLSQDTDSMDMEQVELAAADLEAATDAAENPTLLEADGDTVTIEVEADSVDAIKDAVGSDGGEDLEGDEGDSRELQDLAMVVDIVERAESEGLDSSENTVEDLMDFVTAEMDVDEEAMSAIQDAADAFLQAVEADSLDAVSAESMRDWAREQMDEGEGEEESDDGDGMNPEEQLKGLREENRELRDKIESIEERLDDDSGGTPKSLAANGGNVEDGEDEEDRPAEILMGSVEDPKSGYVGR